MNKRKMIVQKFEDCMCLWMNNRGSILAKIGNLKEISKSLGLEEEFTYDELNSIVSDITRCDAEIISIEEFNGRYKKLLSEGKKITVI